MRRVLIATVACVAASCVLGGGLLTASSASAAGYGLTSTFGSEGSVAGKFIEPGGVAIDDETEDVYVVDKGNSRVEVFNSTGMQVEGEFDGSGAPAPLAKPEGIAVDNDTSSPSHGDVYVVDSSQGVIDKFSATGVYQGQLAGTCENAGETPPSCQKFTPFEELRGVAVGPEGSVWVYNTKEGGTVGSFDEFGDTGDYKETSPTEHGTDGSGLAVDSEGDFYAPCCASDIVRVTPAGEQVARFEVGETDLAIAPLTNDLFVDEGSGIAAFGPFGEPYEPLEHFGVALTSSSGIAVSPAGTVYASDSANDNVSIYKPGVGEAPAILDETSSISGQPVSAVLLAANVNLNNRSIFGCKFEYGTDESLTATTTVPCEPEEFEPEEANAHGQIVKATISGLEPGGIYYYRATASNGKRGKGKIESLQMPNVPVLGAGEAQSITQTSATISGTVNPEGAETTYHFAYIDQAGYEKALAGDAEEKANPYAEGETTVPVEVAASRTTQAVGPLPIAGLLPGKTYHYAFVADNVVGLTVGPDRTLTTSSGTPPLVNTGGASGVSQNTATLTGTVTTNGLQTNYGFEIGTEPGNYGPATGLGSIGGAATEEVSVALGKLQTGTTYYYRVEATNADGSGHGEPESFTTPGFPTLLTAPTSQTVIPYTTITQLEAKEAKEDKGIKVAAVTKTLTNKEKLAKALKVCKREKSKTKRLKCEKAAHKKYPVAKAKKKA
jgi:streptogramin lyase